MKEKRIELVIKSLSFDELNNQDQDLVEKAKKSSNDAYAPYSGFMVGASLLLENGKIINANNQENVAYPSGLCAERVGIFYASAEYPNIAINTIAIAAFSKSFQINDMISPCGSCRQVMAEYEEKQNSNIKMILYSSDENILVLESVKDLLPLLFKMPLLKNH
ncbi:MAG: cytidine deaminase [Bacteroidota bacterium]|nr:cytidine deaminase [Bacteroidota bacterium]